MLVSSTPRGCGATTSISTAASSTASASAASRSTTSPTRWTPKSTSAKSSARTCRMRYFPSCDGSRAMWWLIATKSAASSSPATPRTSTIRRPGSGSTPDLATPSISAGSLRQCMPAGAAPALLDTYETERRPVGIRNVGHADESHAGDRERTPGSGHCRRYAGRRARPSRARRRHRGEPDQQGDHRRACARLSLRSLAHRLARRHAGAGIHRHRLSSDRAARAAARRTPGSATGARPSTCSATVLC